MATRRLVLVAGVAQPATRHPRATATALASLAELAPGRVVVGLGIGGPGVRLPHSFEAPRPYAALRGAVADLEPPRMESAGRSAPRPGWTASRSLPLLLPAGGPRLAGLAARLADWALLAGAAVDDLPALAAAARPEVNGARRPALAWSASLAWEPAVVEACVRGVDVAGDPEDVVARLTAVREAIRPDLFVLPARALAGAAAFVEGAAPLLAAAGFGAGQRAAPGSVGGTG